MEPAAPLRVSRQDDVVYVVLNRPDKRNALTRSLLADLLTTLKTLPASTRLVVLAAEGTVFCAGMDLKEMAATAVDPQAAAIWLSDAELYRQVVETLFFLPCPTLCALCGPALAGGVGLVLACDLILASDSASFALPEPKRGITASIVSPLLKHRIGAGRAGFLLLSGETLTAEEATRFGLIHRLVATESLASTQADLTASILSGAPLAQVATKQQLLAEMAGPIHDAWDQAVADSAKARGLPEAREGLLAFEERRPPNWVSPNHRA